ncbi:hypothetical protein CAEBREN_06164 [Caenorhabditis brenneri]|uniref:Uncharacterized protein n=1 Tax=Caenorhabditis brenneri TaxID=135651 RepID=G0NJZ4_CAEBE|nr:hypothetical protein CAEBREN_06164 [Caenorhabditis brenneri]
MIRLKLFIPLVLFGAIQASTRMCAQCVAGDFLFRRNLMQDSQVGMSMGWIEEWKDTNCVKGMINTIECDHACLKITIIKTGAEKDAIEGVMMDCSDLMIHRSPDLPSNIDFKAYDENAIFSGMRRNFTITYHFTMQGSENVKAIAEQYKTKTFPYYREEFEMSTIVIAIFLSVAVIACVLFVFWNCVGDICCKGKNDYYHMSQVHYTARVAEESLRSRDYSTAPSSPSTRLATVENHVEQKNENIPII